MKPSFKEVAPKTYGLKNASAVSAAYETNSDGYASPGPWNEKFATAQTDIIKKGVEIGILQAPQNKGAFDISKPMLRYTYK